MSQLNDYKNITKEVLQFFAYKIRELNQAGIHDIIVDPGFGFAKNVSQNYELLRNIEYLHLLDKPVLVGISRKSMIYKTLGISADGATNGTSVLNTFSVLHGANILRVHDVQEAKQVVGLCKNF
jgi:dihydropteroate synthase